MAFFQDQRPSREPFLNAPATIFWLIGVLVAAHVIRVMLPAPWPRYLLFEFAFIPARYSEAALTAGGIPAPGLAGQVIPFVSYMFLHGDYTHLAVNSLWLLAFGPIVAKRLGTTKFLLFFLFCGIVSAVVHLAVYFGAAEPVVGASGGDLRPDGRGHPHLLWPSLLRPQFAGRRDAAFGAAASRGRSCCSPWYG